MDWNIGNYWALALLPVVFIMGGLLFRFLKWRNRKKELFADERFHEFLFAKNSRFTKVFPVLYLIGFVFLVLAMADFIKGSQEVKTQHKMNNVLFVLDVSNSMNAEDVQMYLVYLNKAHNRPLFRMVLSPVLNLQLPSSQ